MEKQLYTKPQATVVQVGEIHLLAAMSMEVDGNNVFGSTQERNPDDIDARGYDGFYDDEEEE